MDLVDHIITKILVPPHKVTEGEDSWWEVTVEYDCYGCKDERTFQTIHKSEIEWYKVGYTWAG